MKRKVVSLILSVLAVAVLISGCSNIPFLNSDAKFAREVLDALYSGSLSSIQDSLAQPMQDPMAAQMVAQSGPELRQHFGEVQSLELKSDSPAPGAANMTLQIWTITAERGTFELNIVLNTDGKLEGVWARPPSS